MGKIILNQFDMEKSVFDWDGLNAKYDFWYLEREPVRGSYCIPSCVVNDPILLSSALAVQYSSGNRFVVMFEDASIKGRNKHKQIITDLLSKHIKDFPYNPRKEGVYPCPVSFESEIQLHQLLQLLFNALKRMGDNSGEHKPSLLSGKLYVISKQTEKYIQSVQLNIHEDCIFSLDGVNFMPYVDKGKNAKKGKYVVENGIIRLATDADKDKPFYMFASERDGKKRVDSLIVSAKGAVIPAFDCSKMGILVELMRRFNEAFGEYITLKCKEEYDWNTISFTRTKFDNMCLCGAKTLPQGKSICIVNVEPSTAAQKVCQDIVAHMKAFCTKNKLSFSVNIEKEISAQDLNICVLHDKEYYKKRNMDDPYKEDRDAAVQHITIEDMPSKLDMLCSVCINELIIKNDLVSHSNRISIMDWRSFGIKDTITFYTRVAEDKKQNGKTAVYHYYYMQVSPDGLFFIGELQKGKEYEGIRYVFENRKQCEGIISNRQREYNFIYQTSKFMLPDGVAIRNGLKEGLHVRNVPYRDLYCGSIDIWYKKDSNNNSYYYSIGELFGGSTMKYGITNFARIRKVEPDEYAPLFFDRRLLLSLAVPFVRNKRFTAVPFPFKYLREYAKLHGNFIVSDKDDSAGDMQHELMF